MKKITLELQNGGGSNPKRYITLFLSGMENLAITDDKDGSSLNDGRHNNGGWPLKLTQQEIVAQLSELFQC